MFDFIFMEDEAVHAELHQTGHDDDRNLSRIGIEVSPINRRKRSQGRSVSRFDYFLSIILFKRNSNV